MKMKWFLAIGLVLILSLGVVGIASAQAPDTPPNPPAGAPLARGEFFEPVADLLGMSVDDLTAELKSGKTLEEIVTEQGKTMADVATVIYDTAVEKLNQAVADGKMTQEQADTIEQRLAERRDACINDGDCQLHPPKRSLHDRLNPKAVFNQVMETGLNIADALNMDPRDMLQAFRDGSSLQDLAEQQGVSMDDIAAAITAPMKDRLAQALDDGKMTQEQYDKALERLQKYENRCATDGKCLPSFGAVRHPARPHRGGNGNQPFRPGAAHPPVPFQQPNAAPLGQ
ncbi:MAG TPA: hypothetical protein ENJ48_02995 [Anaerolineae bacterium]|nr:hypothetical protein [Anaerolineae bacterium]